MTTTKKISVNITLLTIMIATSSFGNYLAAQESGRLFLIPGKASDVRVMESDGAVTRSAIDDNFHIAIYSKSDGHINDPVERQWSNGRDKQSVDQQSGITENGPGHWRRQSLSTNDDFSINASVKLSFDSTDTDAGLFNLGVDTEWHLPNMKNLYASIDPGTSLPSFYGGTAGDSVFEEENPLIWKDEKNDGDGPRHNDWSLPQTVKLKHILNYSLFHDKTGSAAYETIFGENSIINAVVQNNYTDSDLKTGQPFMNSTDFSILPDQETGQTHYWSSNYHNFGSAYDEVDSVYDVNIITIDTQGSITGITKIIKGLLPD